MPPLTAVLLNCTLKPSPAASNTEALMRKVVEWYDRLDVVSDLVRVTDYDVKFGMTSDEDGGDEWLLILKRIKAADIIVMGTPIRFGARNSVAQMVIERLDGSYPERNDVGQYPLYNKVGGVVVTGDQDGARTCAEATLFKLSHFGCTIPPHAAAYRLGNAGPGPSSIDTGGQNHAYTQRTTRRMAHNTVHLARLLREQPIPPDGDTFNADTGRPVATVEARPRNPFANLPTGADDIDPVELETEQRAAEQDRLIERRRTLDLTWREKGLPEKRGLPRIRPHADEGDAPDAGDPRSS